MTILSDLVRLVIIILLLPVILILIGPLLILAVIRGRQPMGPIILNTSRYGFAGRSGLFGLGLAVWLLVWGGLGWLGVAAVSPPTLAQVNTAGSTPSATPVLEPTLTATSPSPSMTPTSPAPATLTSTLPVTETPTGSPATSTATPTPSPTPLQASGPTQTPTPEPEVTPTVTPRLTTPAPTATPTITPTIGATLTVDERGAAVRAVREANTLLRSTLALANKENLKGLRIVWQDKAAAITQSFETELYDPSARPFMLDFEYMSPPLVSAQNSDNQATVTSRERWSYRGPGQRHEEAFEFIYTLIQQEGRWLVISYTYRSVKLPLPGSSTATPTRSAPPTPTSSTDQN
jgi:hypothetical protein